MNKGKIFGHLHALGLTGEQTLRVYQLIGRETVAAVDAHLARKHPRMYRKLNETLTRFGEQEGLIFDEHQTEKRCTDTAGGSRGDV